MPEMLPETTETLLRTLGQDPVDWRLLGLGDDEDDYDDDDDFDDDFEDDDDFDDEDDED